MKEELEYLLYPHEMKTTVAHVGLFFMCFVFKTSLFCDAADNVTCKGPEACVYDEIFDGYNKLVRPVKDYDQVIDVHLQLVLNGLLDIEEKEEFMRVVGFFRAFWYDDLLKWDPNEHSNVTEIVVPAEEIWIPDIGITNSVSNFYEITYKRDFHLKIHYTGKIRWSFGGILTTSCDIDLTFYPFDEQECDIEVESWQYEEHKVRLLPIVEESVNLDTVGDDPQWILQNATGAMYLKYGGKYSSVKFSLHWIRKPLYFYVNIILPSAYMAIITLGVFWLPAECGEKMSLAITVVLAFSVFQIVIMEITPVSSDAIPKITELVITVMSLATVSLLSSMFVAYLSDHPNPPPRWVKKVFLYYIPKYTGMSSHKLYEEELFGKKIKPGKEAKHVKDSHVYKKYFVDDTANGMSSLKTSSPTAIEMNETIHTSVETDEKPSQKQEASPESQKVHNRKNTGKSKNTDTRTKDNILLVKDVKEILLQLDYMKGKITEEEQSQKIKEDWKHIGRAIDRMVFWLSLIILLFYIIYSYFKVKYAE